ncbi:MAG: ribosome maturation factor RimM [Desulfovibrionaceae bacterium]
MSNFVTIAKVIKAHGITGEICLEYFAHSLALLEKDVFLGYAESSSQSVIIESMRFHKERPLIRLSFVKDRTAAEKIRGAFLFIRKIDLPQDDKESLYFHDLLNMSVYTETSYLGIITDVQSFPGQEIWYITGKNNEEILFPVVNEFIISLSQEERKIIISPPPGLLELYT